MKKRRFLPICLFLLLALLLFLEYRFPSLALAVDRLIGVPMRTHLASFSGLFDVSLAEGLLLLLPIVAALLPAVALTSAKSAASTRRLLNLFLSFLLVFFAMYVLAFAPGHCRAPLADTLELSDDAPTKDEVLSCISWLASLSAFDAPYPGDEAIEEHLRATLADAGEKYGFSANAAVSVKKSRTPLFLRLGYFGLYAFPFGEITLTSACPEATRAFTLAHEMAHASGFSREEEADAVAFLACLDSNDPYLVSAAATGMLGRALCALYASAPALWERASALLSDTARRELSDAGEVYEQGMTEAGAAVAEDYGAALGLLCAVYRARINHELRAK